MNRPVVQAHRGIALVITLIMLSVVTITAVTFLAVSRRERGAVNASGEQLEARYAADSALNRVKAEIASRIHASGNRSAFGLIVSTNYASEFFDPAKSYADVTNRTFLTNVAYHLASGPFNLNSSAGRDTYSRMLANLFYDPRPPVFVPTNSNPNLPPDFRFYLDINRNGRFETNGWQRPRDQSDREILTSPSEFMVGDPEWIGILEHPNLPHSGTNHFGARFAYLVLPAGREMDANFIYNSVKNVGDTKIDGSFMRDQGVGGWELNLAGFLSDLNTNVWSGPANTYNYQADRNVLNSGRAFIDAGRFLTARRQVAGNPSNPTTATAFFRSEASTAGATAIKNLLQNQNKTNAVDWYSDGMSTRKPIRTLAEIHNPPIGDDVADNFWPGGDYVTSFTDYSQFLAAGMGGNLRFELAGTASGVQSVNRTYDRYTFQRLLAQLGTDGSDARFETGFQSGLIRTNVSPSNPQYNRDGFYRRAKLNLNFRQADPGGDTASSASVAPFQDWQPLEWFTNAADRMMLTEFTNGLPRKIAGDDALPGIAVTGYYTNLFTRQRFQTNAYTAQLHRLLQVSANIYDYMTNRVVDYRGASQAFPFLPSVFEPVLYREKATRFNPNGVSYPITRIARFDLVTNNAELQVLRQPWVDLNDADFTRVFGKGLVPDTKDSARDNLLGPNSLTKALYVDMPMVIGAKKGFPNFNEGLWQSAVRVTRRLFVTKARPDDTLTVGVLPFNQPNFTTYVQYRFQLTNHFSVEAWNSYSSNLYAKGLPRSVRLIATNVLSFGLFHDDATNNVTQALASSGKVALAPQSPFVRTGNYLVAGTNIDLGTTPANRWLGGDFIRALNGELRFDFTYAARSPLVTDQTFNTNKFDADFLRVDASFPPQLHLLVTNRMMFALVDRTSGALLDYVNLKSVVTEADLLRFYGAGTSTAPLPAPALDLANGLRLRMPDLWNTNSLRGIGAVGATVGISNQLAASLGMVDVGNLWQDAPGQGFDAGDRVKAINKLYYFLYRQFPTDTALKLPDTDRNTISNDFRSTTNYQAGFNPSPALYLTDRLQANEPLVHYTREDLAPGYSVFCDSGNYSELPGPDRRLTSDRDGFQLTTNSVVDLSGQPLPIKLAAASGGVVAYAPWGQQQMLRLKADAGISTNLYYKDPQITGSDAWAFPTNAQTKFPGIGFLGRVHRGTPWQTLYLKSTPLQTNTLDGHV
ncbi:MAG TPA: pilus assembly PilX N-terminal domain-containing protein, partial [Candidatus Limnocylindria bacterium]|nr:pilus assembly PilX N-terminal domain-containing protein [Candidatus Limnocylindria bacterium]